MNQNLLTAMQAELKRSFKHLHVPGHPKLYFLSYLVKDVQQQIITSKFGALDKNEPRRKRICYVDARVGDSKYDQLLHGGLKDNQSDVESHDILKLPVEDSVDGLRFFFWRLTDAKYREAVQMYHEKKSQDICFQNQNMQLDATTPIEITTQNLEQKALLNLEKSVDKDHWIALTKQTSKVFQQFPDVKNSYVEFSAQMITKTFVSSEGHIIRWQEPLFGLSTYYWFHSDASDLDGTLSHFYLRPEELPTSDQLCEQILKRMAKVKKIDLAPRMSSFSGPVLLSSKASGLLLHEVLGHRLEGSRLLSDEEGGTFKDRIGDSIIHDKISLYDDPTLDKYGEHSLLGHYQFDDEGQKPERTTLVTDGVLKNFLSTRTPFKEKDHRSNGHARAQSFERPISRMANLIIETKNGLEWQELKQKLVEEIKEQEVSFGMIIYEVEGGETGTESYDFQAYLGQITIAAKVYPDGREEFVKGVDFVGTPLSSLNSIIEVGNSLEVDNSFCGAESGTIPVSTIAPALLLSDLELQAKDRSKVSQYALPLPWFDQIKK